MVQSVDELKEQGFDAVLVGWAAHRGLKLPIPGSESEGYSSTRVPETANLGEPVPVGER